MNTALPETLLVLQALRALQAQPRPELEPTPTVCVQVTASRGSAPRRAGAMMLISRQTIVGTIGGGHLEHTVVATARHVLSHQQSPQSQHSQYSLQTAHTLPSEQEYPLGAALGQCCGGAMRLRFEMLNAASIDALIEQLNAQTQAFKTLFLFGAGHVAQALIPLLAALPLRVVWGDTRDAINAHQNTFPSGLPAQVSTVISDSLEAELSTARTGDLALIMTHSHALDETLTQAALNTPQLAYIGLIGSLTKRRLFEQRFNQRFNQHLGQRVTQRGLSAAQFERLTCPIGLPSTTTAYSKWPAVIALQVAAQLTAYV